MHVRHRSRPPRSGPKTRDRLGLCASSSVVAAPDLCERARWYCFCRRSGAAAGWRCGARAGVVRARQQEDSSSSTGRTLLTTLRGQWYARPPTPPPCARRGPGPYPDAQVDGIQPRWSRRRPSGAQARCSSLRAAPRAPWERRLESAWGGLPRHRAPCARARALRRGADGSIVGWLDGERFVWSKARAAAPHGARRGRLGDHQMAAGVDREQGFSPPTGRPAVVPDRPSHRPQTDHRIGPPDRPQKDHRIGPRSTPKRPRIGLRVGPESAPATRSPCSIVGCVLRWRS